MSRNKKYKITKEVFDKIKFDLDFTCLSREVLMAKHEVGRETLRLISRSANYSEYLKHLKRKRQQAKINQNTKLLKARKMVQDKQLEATVLEIRDVRKNSQMKIFLQLCGLAVGILVGYLLACLVGGVR